MTWVLVSEPMLAIGLGAPAALCSNSANSAQLEITGSSLGAFSLAVPVSVWQVQIIRATDTKYRGSIKIVFREHTNITCDHVSLSSRVHTPSLLNHKAFYSFLDSKGREAKGSFELWLLRRLPAHLFWLLPSLLQKFPFRTQLKVGRNM